MICWKSEFRFLNRGFKETVVLIPGWATDYRIFNNLDLNYNYLLTARLYPFNFNQPLLEELDKQKIDRVSLFGFSLGGFLAAEFAVKYPDRIDQLILVGIRKAYAPQVLKDIEQQLRQNKPACLYKFYLSCFSRADPEGLNWFKEHLLKQYTDEFPLENLIWGLDYLASHQIQPESLARMQKIKIFHGSDDLIAPLEEALQIKSQLAQAEFVYLKDAGHLPFFNPQFQERFYRG